MWVLRQLSLMLALVFIAPFTFAEDGPMSKQQQCEEYNVYQDGAGNWIDCVDGLSQKNDVDESYPEEPYVEDTYQEEPYVDDTYTEEPYVEDTYQEEPYIEESYEE